MRSGTTKLSRAVDVREQLRVQLQSRSVLLFVTLASIGDAVITTDSDGDITFLNPVAETLTGWNLRDAVGLNIEDVFVLVNEVTGNRVANPIREALVKVSKVDLPEDTILVRKDGSRIPIDDSGAPILGSEDEVLGAVLVFRDITERKKSEQMIKYRSELDRMAARISTGFITSAVTEVDVRINEALRTIGEFFDADRAYVVLFNRGEPTMTCTHEWHAEDVEPRLGSTIGTYLTPYWTSEILERRHVAVSGLEDIPDAAVAEREYWLQKGLKTFVAIPMSQETRCLGFIGLESTNQSRDWPEETLNMLYLVGNVFANAMARRDAQRRLEAARAREVEIGSRIQQTLLLSAPPLASPDFQVATITIPSRGVDGDFYDFLLHPNRTLDVIFGDVMGKGVPAALLSAGAKTEFLRSLSHLLVSSPRGSIPQPEDIVNSVHSVLTPQLLNLDSFVTLSYARFNPQSKKVTLVDCGNTRLMRCPWGEGDVEYLAGVNLPLGFSTAEVYSDVVYDYSPGDLFVLYSDGVTEARNPAGEMFGTDRLRDLIATERRASPVVLAESIRDSVITFVGSGLLADDLTCVVLRITPVPEMAELLPYDELEVLSNLNELSTIRAFLRGFCEHRGYCGVDDKELTLMELAVNEVASNIMRHAYHGRTDQRIWVRIIRQEEMIRVRLIHTGDPFRQMENVRLPSLKGAKEGGFGLFIINRAVDTVDYGQEPDDRQYIELAKKIES